MKQNKITSIWSRPKKGVRAGNSPIWEGEEWEQKKTEAKERITKRIWEGGNKDMTWSKAKNEAEEIVKSWD